MVQATESDVRGRPMRRQPVALVCLGERLYVANRCGTLATLDAQTGEVLAEQPVAQQLVALARLGNERTGQLIAVDKAAHRLIILEVLPRQRGTPGDVQRREGVRILERLPVPHTPAFCVSDPVGVRIFVASVWARQVTCWQRRNRPSETHATWSEAWRTDLTFAPRGLVYLEGRDQLVVGDAFGGTLALLDGRRGDVRQKRVIPGHQLRGMGLLENGKRLVIAQQVLNPLARTDDNDVHWGILMSNDLRWLKLTALLDPRSDLFDQSHMTPLGEASHGAADPAGLVVVGEDSPLVVVALAGVGEIAYGRPTDYVFRRMRVGRHPTAVAARDRRRIFVADTFDDTISVIDMNAEERIAVWRLGPTRPPTLAEKGEMAFYDGHLSMDGWMSCHSCHVDGHTNGLLNDNLSDGSYETSKRVLSLLGRAGTAPFAWGGTSATLEDQVGRSIQKTMRFRGEIPPGTRQAIAAFLRTLEPPPGIDAARGRVDRRQVERGKALFEMLGCADCHVPPRYTSEETYDVGLVDERGMRMFNPPTLLGVSQRHRWLHDGRARSLEEVLTR
ncbi:MAG TPA: hypothetical protein ENJ50_07730, partial [Planctomycetaceae bacterium]|nr:hypothetical protein [Planctomycetaceae bacterium]